MSSSGELKLNKTGFSDLFLSQLNEIVISIKDQK
jgi:hypothetical protein